MKAENVEAWFRGVVADQLGIGEDEIKPESLLVEDLGADSLDLVEFALALEEECELFESDEELAQLKTFGDVVRFLKGKVTQCES